MKTNELLRSEPQYRLILATHAMLRMIGYSADDIYVAIGKNPCVVLKRDGLEFVITVGAGLARPHEQFCEEWMYISKHNHEISDEIGRRSRDDWRDIFNIAQLIAAIRLKGIQLPRTDRNERQDLH